MPNLLERKKKIISSSFKIENRIKKLKIENSRLIHENRFVKEVIKENEERIASNSNLPHLVATISEIFKNGKNKNRISLILKTSNRLNIFVNDTELYKNAKDGFNNLVGVNRDNYFIMLKNIYSDFNLSKYLFTFLVQSSLFVIAILASHASYDFL